MTFSELLTPRLVLRRLRLSDCAAMFAVRSDPRVSRFQMWEPRSVEEIQSFVEGLQDLEPDMPGTWFQIAITLRHSGLLIGDCGLHFPPGEAHQAEVGITLAPDHQGQGYATEALNAALDYLFLSLGKHRVFASVDPRNRASIALLEWVGMRKEAHFRESVWCKGEWADDLVFAVLEGEWRARRSVGDAAEPG
jgi:RimJ/RimL family protein N-acetyltransferase